MKYSSLRIPVLCASLLVVVSCGQRTKGNEDEEQQQGNAIKKVDTITYEKADSINKVKVTKSRLDEDEIDFLLKATDARMMGILEGKAAVAKSTNTQLKNYGTLMIKDQSSMLASLKKLCKDLSVTLPDSISQEKKDGLKKLQSLSGKRFDKKFIRMMKIDHRRDIKLFTKAKDYENDKVKKFASQYEPLIESHLDQLKEATRRKPREKAVKTEKVAPK